jgi:hypothetical protein
MATEMATMAKGTRMSGLGEDVRKRRVCGVRHGIADEKEKRRAADPPCDGRHFEGAATPPASHVPAAGAGAFTYWYMK